MLNIFQTVFLSILQGVTEMFPISSVGHIVLIPGLFKWQISSEDSSYLAFVVMIHVGSVVALILLFWEEWKKVVLSLLNLLKTRKQSNEYYEHLGLLLIIGTIPVGILGLIFEHKIKSLFTSPIIAAVFLVVNGFILLIGEVVKKKGSKLQVGGLLDFKLYQAFIVGIVESLALIPGISRSGSSMVGGLIQGLNHEDSAKLSFMLATPAILAASLLEMKYLFHSLNGFFIMAVGAMCAGIASYLSTKFLMKYFKEGTLMPFVYYSWIVGLICLFVFKFVY